MQLGQKMGLRLPRMAISNWDRNILHKKNPWMPMWWSAAFPGLGHLCQGVYLKGSVLMLFETLVNFKAKLNLAILHTFTGDFNRAKEILDTEWALIYGVIFCFAIFDSQRITVELNLMARLEKKQPRHFYKFMSMSPSGLNYIGKGNPWVAAAWSALLPGFGHLYNNRGIKGLIILGWILAIINFSHVNDAIISTLTGNYSQNSNMINYQWLLFFPSIYNFALWDAYNDSVETNKLFDEEQRQYIKKAFGPGRIRSKNEPSVEH